MDWRRAESGLRYRIAGSGAVVVELESGRVVIAESRPRGAAAWYEATADYRMLVTAGDGMFQGATLIAGIRGPGRVVLQGQRRGTRGQ